MFTRVKSSKAVLPSLGSDSAGVKQTSALFSLISLCESRCR
ncbi:hypothetical protein [Enterococcus phage PEF1]